MRSNMLVHLLVVGWILSGCADASTDMCQDVEVGTNNKQLLYAFNWNPIELKSVTCHKYGTMIGQCRGINLFVCSVEQPFSGLFKITPNAALTQVTLTITDFDETRAGEYCCSKEGMKESTCQCIKVVAKVTPAQVASTGILWGHNSLAIILTTTAVLFYSSF